MIEEAYKKSIEIIKLCSTKNGLFASAPPTGYTAVWARDSIVTFLGASLVNNIFKKDFYKTLITLTKYQSKLGQIPNCIDLFSQRKKQVTFSTIDSSLWYIIGEHIYAKRYNDKTLLRKHKKAINKALLWIKYQDAGEDKLPEQQPTSDWQDAFPHKYGHTLNTQALYYAVLELCGKRKEADEIKKLVNSNNYLCLFDKQKGYYLPYAWKDHNGLREQGGWFDSLGNLLAIVFGLADKEKANKILNHIKRNKINRPYPIKAIYPPIKPGDPDWKDYYIKCDAGTPGNYLNGGVWTFIGGFYVIALIAMKKYKEAERELKNLARANLQSNFSEWIHPKTKKPFGKLQAWDAGMYIAAYHSLKEKKSLLNI